MHTITESDTGPVPASLLAPGHVTVEGVVDGVYPFTDDDGTEWVNVEHVGGGATEWKTDDDVTVLAVVDRTVLHALQDAAR